MELLDALACSLEQSEELLLVKDTELPIAATDTPVLLLVLIFFPPMVDVESLAQCLALLLKGSVLCAPDLLVDVHLEILMHTAIATHVRLKLEVAHLQLLAISPHLIETRAFEPLLRLCEVVLRLVAAEAPVLKVLIEELPAVLGIERCVDDGAFLYSLGHVLYDRLLLDIGDQIATAPVALSLYEAED